MMTACFDGPRDVEKSNKDLSNSTELSYKTYEPDPDNLCLLNDYSNINLMSFGEFTAFDSDVEGRAYAKGDVFLMDYAIGKEIDDDSTLPSLVSNGSVGIRRSSIVNGPVYYANDFIASDSDEDIEAIQKTDFFNFDLAKSSFVTFAEYANTLTQNADVSFEDKDLLIEVSGSDIQVAKIDGDTLNDTRKIDITSDTDSPLLVVVNGDNIKWGELDFTITESYKHKVFFVFPDAQEIWVEKLVIFSHIIAPNARFVYSEGAINGNVVVKKFIGQGQVNKSHYPDLCDEVEPPCQKGYDCDSPDQND